MVREHIDSSTQTKELTGAEMLIEALRRESVEVIFGYPGGAVLPLYDKLYNCGIKHVLAKHEQGGIHAAEGYARVSGKPGVVIATSGPGATNLVTGLTDAMIDSLPLVVFTGQVATAVIGTDAFQEADIIGVTMPITKHSYQVRDVSEIPRIIKEAFHIATTGRPGPVLIDLPKDITNQKANFDYDVEIQLPGYQPTIEPSINQIRKVSQAISQAKKPVILAGAGVIFSGGSGELLTFAEQQKVPVASTLLGLGSFPASHPLFLGMAGMHGTYAANMALHECDFLLSIGARFDDRVTGDLKHFAPNAVVAHIDIDPAEIGKNIHTKIPVVGDALLALQALIEQNGKQANHEEWLELLQDRKQNYPLWFDDSEDEIKPQKLIQLIHSISKGKAIVTTDVGQHQMWSAQYYEFLDPNRWVTSGGLGTMGFGVPAAIGAQIAAKDELVISIVGDGGFLMTMQELALIVELKLPIKIVIANNRSLGMVRQWQELFFEERYSSSLLHYQVDYSKLAEAFGMKGFHVTSPNELENVLKESFDYEGPVLINVQVSEKENVYPMIAPGKGLHEMVGVKK